MGIARGYIKLLMDAAAVRPFHGRIMQLGRQDVYATWEELVSWAEEQQFTLQDPGTIQLSLDPERAALGHIDDQTLFHALGFEDVCSLDFGNHEHPTHLHDLNCAVPEDWQGTCDMVFDGGTCEHIFNLPMVLSNIHLLLKPGGRVVHGSPSSNHVDHGYYMFSPVLFYDWYTVNRYEIETSRIFTYRMPGTEELWDIYNYTPGVINHLWLGGWDQGNLLGIWMVATKLRNTWPLRVPQQGHFLREVLGFENAPPPGLTLVRRY